MAENAADDGNVFTSVQYAADNCTGDGKDTYLVGSSDSDSVNASVHTASVHASIKCWQTINESGGYHK